MPKGLRLKDAEKARDDITAKQLKLISGLYNNWADDIAKRAEVLKKKSNISAELQVKQLEELEAALRKTSKKVANDVASAVKAGMFKVCQSVVSQNADWMESLGFPKDAILAAFSSVPDNVVRNIITGKIYDTGWSLSKSIWGDNEDTLTKVHQIVSGGIAENRPVYDIAKELEQYVRPGAKKQWNLRTESGKMIYPKQVDYNAQRLVRTLSQHAYQQSIKATSSENPFIQKVRWHSTGNRVCEICKKRNGKIYPINKLPMDHPNGFCIMEQLVDDDMDDRLIAWAKGKEDKDLDEFAKKFGFGVEDMNIHGDESDVKESKEDKQIHNVVQGKDILGEWNRRSEFDFEIEDVINYQGFDGLPRIVDADEFDELVKKSRFIAQRTYSANSQEILDSYRDMLYNGKWYVDCGTGGAQYGQGMYCAADYDGVLSEGILSEMKDYQELNTVRGNPISYTETFTLDESARVIKYKDVKSEYIRAKMKEVIGDNKKINKQLEVYLEQLSERDRVGIATKKLLSSEEKLESMLKKEYGEKEFNDVFENILQASSVNYELDNGTLAVLMGYDAINAEGHGESGSYTIILNRTKLIIKRS